MKSIRKTFKRLFSNKKAKVITTSTTDKQRDSVNKVEQKKKVRRVSGRGRRLYDLKSNGKRVGHSNYGGGTGPSAQNQQAIFSPQRKKLKGYQKDHKGRKVA